MRREALLTHAVEEALAYVQGESLKASAALLTEAFKLPDHQAGEMMMAIGEGRQHHDDNAEEDQRSGCIGKIAKGLGAVAVLALLTHLVFALLGPKDTPTAEEAAKQKLSKQQSMAVSTAVQTIKESLRNPASAEWVRVTASKDGSIVCVTVRAQNGFGGMSVDQYSAHEYHLSRSVAQWNKYCAGRTLEDLTQAVRLMFD